MSYRNHDESFRPSVESDNTTLIENLRTWYPATVGELSGVMGTLELVQDDIVDYDAKLEQLHSFYNADLARLRSEYQTKRHYTELLSAIRRLPNEILCQIFLYCCAENDIRNGKPGEALTLSSVCTRFREVAISYPALWSNLTAFFPAAEDYDYHTWEATDAPGLHEQDTKLSSLIQLYLDRSKDRPLTLDLNIEERYQLPDRPSVQLLTRESNRWKHLVLRGGFSDSDPLHPSREPLPSPSLESVEFRYWVISCANT
ncbi:hypothetical protein BDP27DRAFT_234947 [Rhodocollybia butyracea]|uniref:F-box domain-containing protein n=1 Tax=Rhodocollybia butyracea TaxID=206335 RepID=A0A9P5PK07_9AGAR|nr:hypothetical protein BDP27DRAFT_234947 [Rhodocollybia butyracea]